MSLAFFYVLSQMVFGCLALTPAVPFEIFGVAFFRVNAMTFFLMLWAVCGWIPVPGTESPGPWLEFACFHGAMVVLGLYNVALWVGRDRPWTPLVWVATGLGFGTMIAGAFACPIPIEPGWQRGVLALSFIASAFLTGGALMGMLLGHWYLMKPKLPFEPLIAISRRFVAAAIAALGVFAALQLAQLTLAPYWAMGLAFAPRVPVDLLIWARLVVGLLMPLGMSYMILESSRLQANMSATGLFYVAFAVAAAGDLVARGLLMSRGLPN